MKETKFKQTLVQTKEASRHCEHSEAIQGGFKMTEVGLIPNDWDVKLLGEIADVRDGTHDSPKYYDIGYKFVTSKNLINGKIDFSNIQYISKNDFDKINERSKVDINDILFAMIGTIGNPVLITKEPDFAIKNVALFKDKRCTNQVYLKFYLSSAFALNRMLDDAKGSNQKFIPLSYFRSFQIPLPPTIEEQQRIANALSDVDTLINNLEKLIAKKKNIKQGAMQQLLTGRKRLPGFAPAKPTYKQTELGQIPADWEVKNFGDVGRGFSAGATPYRQVERYYEGDIKWVSSGELDYNVIQETQEHISMEAVKATNLTLHPKGTFLMAITGLEAAGTRGRCAILGCEATTNQSCLAIYESEYLSIPYLYHFYVKYGDTLAFAYAQGSKQQSFTAAIVKKLPIILPSSKAEQTAIANVLSDMDTEITILETKLAKYRKLKTGMMQQLLTGKIRLV